MNSEAASRWSPVILLAIMLIGATALRGSFGPLQEACQIELHLSDFQIALITGLGTGGSVALFALPVSYLIDHGNRRNLIVALISSTAVGAVWTAFADGFASLLLARMLNSFGQLTAISVAISLSADFCSPRRRPQALLMLAVGIWAGVAGAFALGGISIDYFARHPFAWFGALTPWRQAQLAVTIGGSILVLPMFTVREPVRQEVSQRGASVRDTLRGLRSRRGFLLALLVGQLGVIMADSAANVWAAPILIRDYHQQPGSFGSWMGATIMLAGVLGSLLGGYGASLGQRWTKKPGGVMYGALAGAIVAIPAAAFSIMPSLAGFGTLFAILLICGTVTDLASAIAVAVLIPNEERGVCLSAFAVMKALVGMTLAPVLVTWGSTLLGGREHIAESLAIVGALTGTLAAMGYFFATRLAPHPVASTAPAEPIFA